MASVKHSDVQARDLQRLPTALLSHTLSFLPPNERTLTARFICRDAAAALGDAEAHTASLSQPLPPHAVPWAVEAGQQHVRQLPFRHKLQLMCTAAASGSKVNLEVALALLQPSIFPELLQDIQHDCRWRAYHSEPAVTAIEKGHPQLLGWLLHRCPALVHPPSVLVAAARHCDLAGLQAVWEQLQASSFSSCRQDSGLRPALTVSEMDAAAGSAAPDAVAKMEWVMAESGGHCSLGMNVAAAAARSGDLGRLRWLRDRGYQFAEGRGWLLQWVLLGAGTSAVEWLVDEAGCSLLAPPEDQEEEMYWGGLVRAAAYSDEGVSRVLWLQQRGVPIQRGFRSLLEAFGTMPVTAGEVRVVRFLQQRCGLGAEEAMPPDRELTAGAAESGSISLVEELRQAGLEFDSRAYSLAGGRGDLAMIRWLALEAKVPAGHVSLRDLIEQWPTRTPSHSRDLLQAVQVVVGEAGCREWDAGEVLLPAAARGELALVQYLQQQHKQRNESEPLPGWEVFNAAASSGCEALLDWLAGQHRVRRGLGYGSAATKGDKGTLAALRRLGVPWDAGFTVARAVREGCWVPVLRWLVEQGAPVGTGEEMEQALLCRGGKDPGFDVEAMQRLVASSALVGGKA